MNAIKVIEAYERALWDVCNGDEHADYVADIMPIAREAVLREIIENMMGGSTTLQ